MSGGAFDLFPKSLTDEAADRVQFLLASEPIIRQWNAGGVIRSRMLGPVPGVQVPHTIVAPLSISTEMRPSGELYLRVPVAVAIVWEEFVSVAEPGENSVASAVAWYQRTLLKCPYLNIPEMGGDRLAEKLDSLEPVSLARATADDERTAVLTLTMEAAYQMSIDARTWTRFASPTT